MFGICTCIEFDLGDKNNLGWVDFFVKSERNLSGLKINFVASKFNLYICRVNKQCVEYEALEIRRTTNGTDLE